MDFPAMYRPWTTLQYFQRYSSSPEVNTQNTAKIYLVCVVVGTKGLKTLSAIPRPWFCWKAEILSFLHVLLVWGDALTSLLIKTRF